LIDTIKSKPNVDALTYFYSSMGGISITVGVVVICLAIYGFLVTLFKNYYASIAVCWILIFTRMVFTTNQFAFFFTSSI
jgi:hypothetical protein